MKTSTLERPYDFRLRPPQACSNTPTVKSNISYRWGGDQVYNDDFFKAGKVHLEIKVMISLRLASSNSPLPMLKRLPPEASANALDAFAGIVVLVVICVCQYSWHNFYWYIEQPPTKKKNQREEAEAQLFTKATSINSVSFQDRLHSMIHR